LCVALIDIDHFGLVNKTKAGAWVTGDRALREIGNLIRQNLREGDWVARYGGEEFIVVLPEISFESAVQVLERVRVAIARHQFRDENGGAFSVTISAGVATLRSGETQDEVLPRLCKKVLAAKSAGRNQVRG
jgi:diguanylate cyclase (GGDEF)-like protein